MSKFAKANCDVFTNPPRFIGRQNKKGEVVYGDKEFEYIGLTDKKGNYFYVRLQGKGKESSFSTVPALSSGGRSYKVSTPLRMVLVFRDFDTEIVHYKAISDIMNINLLSIDRKIKPSLEITSSSTDFEQIYRDETGKEIKHWDGNIRLVAVDFNVTYHMEPDDCFKLKLCESVEYSDVIDVDEECASIDLLLQKIEELKGG